MGSRSVKIAPARLVQRYWIANRWRRRRWCLSSVGVRCRQAASLRRKRHLLVDTLGLVVMVVVTAKSVTEWEGARQVFAKVHQIRERFPRLVRIWVDGGYRGEDFMRWVMDTYRWVVEVVLRLYGAKGFEVLPRRWFVERT